MPILKSDDKTKRMCPFLLGPTEPVEAGFSAQLRIRTYPKTKERKVHLGT